MSKINKSKQINKRLYECSDCHTRRFISWVELNRAAKPRCFKCGCTILDLVSDDAKDDQARLNTERILGSGGSLKLAHDCDELERHRSVIGGGVKLHS